MRILVTDANSKNALACARSLKKAGHEVFAAGPSFSISHLSKSCDQVLLTEGPNISRDEILDIVVRNSIEVVIPVSARSVSLLNEVREQLPRSVCYALPDKRVLTQVFDKYWTQVFASGLGIAVPDSVKCESFEQLEAELMSHDLPLVVRSNSHFANLSVAYVETSSFKGAFLGSQTPAKMLLTGPVQLQKKVEGVGAGFFAVYQDGELKRFMIHERVHEFPASGGSSWFAKSAYHESVFTQGKLLLDSLNWHGPAMVEFKLDLETGTAWFIELNPKLWGSLDLTIASGVDVPNLLLEVAAGHPLEYSSTYDKSVSFWWPLDRLTAPLGVLQAVRNKSQTNLKLLDPGPAVISALHLLYILLFETLFGGALGVIRHWVVKNGWRAAIRRVFNEWMGIPSRRGSEIASNLWVGAAPSLLGYYLRLRGRFVIFSLVDLSFDTKSDEHLHFPITEYLAIDEETLDYAASEGIRLLSEGKRIYLHCREGVGRAPTVAAAMLIKLGSDAETAVQEVKASRALVDFTPQQLASIRAYAEYVRPSESKSDRHG